jgi:hypothetical protein
MRYNESDQLSPLYQSPKMSSTLSKQGKQMAMQAASKLVDDVIRERDQVIKKTSKGSTKRKDDIVEDIVRGAAAAVGFVSEAIKYRKAKQMRAKKQADTTQLDVSPGTPQSQISVQGEAQSPKQLQPENQTEAAVSRDQVHDTIWRLDDMHDTAAHQDDNSPRSPQDESRDVAAAFIARHPFLTDAAPDAVTHNAKITCPVVLPQRRPKDRARGFVRAYAPVLADAGIEQDTFLDFIDTFNKVIEPSPWLHAINLAGLAGLSMPMEPMMMLLDLGVALTSAAVIEAQSRFKSNRFLDRLNEEFFAPRGLASFLVTWKPEADDMVTAVNLGNGGASSQELSPEPVLAGLARTYAASSSSPSQMGLGRFQERMRAMTKQSSGITTTSADWPELAPLVFPAVAKTASDEVATESADGEAASSGTKKGKKKKKKNKVERAGDWIDEYMDRTALAKWIDENPQAPVAQTLPRPEFTSRYADPNHPAASGDIVALLTGGRWQYCSGKSAEEDGNDSDESKERVRDEKKRMMKKKNKKQSDSKEHAKEHVTGQWLSLLKSVSDRHDI